MRSQGCHIGKVGERAVFRLRLIYKREFEHQAYGDDDREFSRWLHKFTDEFQEIAIWWGSKELSHADTPERPGALVELGESLDIECKVKDHTVYDGVKQTVLTHVAELTTPEAKKALRAFRREKKREELIAAGICVECKGIGSKKGKVCEACHGGW